MLVDHGFIDERWWDFFSNSNRVGFHEISQDALFRYLLNKDTVEKFNCNRTSKSNCSKIKIKNHQNRLQTVSNAGLLT